MIQGIAPKLHGIGAVPRVSSTLALCSSWNMAGLTCAAQLRALLSVLFTVQVGALMFMVYHVLSTNVWQHQTLQFEFSSIFVNME